MGGRNRLALSARTDIAPVSLDHYTVWQAARSTIWGCLPDEYTIFHSAFLKRRSFIWYTGIVHSGATEAMNVENIHMIGYDARHSADFIYELSGSQNHYLLILTTTPARFWLDGVPKEFPPHQAALFAPDSKGRYGACGDFYGNDWIIFSSDETRVTHFPLLAAPFPVTDPEYCHALFKLLCWEHAQDNYQSVISQLMDVLFHKLRSDLDRTYDDDYHWELQALRREIMSHPRRSWTVEDMAAELHISAGYLQLLYKRQFGVSCIEDVIHNRVRLARDYLTHTRMRVAEIAALCGYNSTEHFSRQFRAVCGMSPAQFRRKEPEG